MLQYSKSRQFNRKFPLYDLSALTILLRSAPPARVRQSGTLPSAAPKKTSPTQPHFDLSLSHSISYLIATNSPSAMSDDEWTTIPSRSRGRNHKPAPPRSLHKTSPDETPTPRTEGPFRSVDDIKAEYASFETQWLTSSTKSSLTDLLKTHLPATLQITSAICLGVGTFDPADGSWQAKRSAFLQLLAFESIVSYIGV